jgi:predicted PhzF superfamily epimerase YddE/YHI9
MKEKPMRLPMYQVDAFTDRLFGGNPAAVVPLEQWLPDATMQSIAAENNLAETAFFLREGADYALRWFTPTVEVDLCGHATLASAHVIFRFLAPARDRISFRTLKAGTLGVARQGEALAMDFPAWPPEPCPLPPALPAALGGTPVEMHRYRQRYLAVFVRREDVAALAPDFAALQRQGYGDLIVTAPGGDGVDFVSRFFAPAHGIDEDPVTGSAHCVLVPYWATRLGKTRLEARQISRRGGVLSCALDGDRVTIAGRCVLYLEGTITV